MQIGLLVPSSLVAKVRLPLSTPCAADDFFVYWPISKVVGPTWKVIVYTPQGLESVVGVHYTEKFPFSRGEPS